MIKINFLKPSVSSKGGSAKKKIAVPIVPVVVLVLIGAVGFGVYYYMMLMDKSLDMPTGFYGGSGNEVGLAKAPDTDKAEPEGAETKVAVKPEEKPAASSATERPPKTVSLPTPAPAPEPAAAKTQEPATVAKAQEPVKPSSLVRTHMIENVVREIGNESRAVKKFDAAYEDMNTVEKINYEVLFARNAFELITRSAGQGVRLRSIEIEDFRTVYINGVSPSREMVEELFSSFRRERGELLPRPLSHIKDNPGGGYQFVVTSKPRFGLELDDPFQALDHLGFKESLTANLRKFSRLAGSNNFKLKAAPRQASVERVGGYRRVVYKAEGESTYRDFHKFVLALYSDKVPCAFKKITLSAKSNDVVSVNAEILFTVKE